jgi:hypothetical protein
MMQADEGDEGETRESGGVKGLGWAIRAAQYRSKLHIYFSMNLLSQLRFFSSSIATSGGEKLIAACILTRLPILLPSPPQWEIDHHVFLREDALKHGLMKDYEEASPSQEAKLPSSDNATIRKFVPVSAPEGLPISSMRRKLSESLFLMLKKPEESRWRFPSVEIGQGGETVREAGERALTSAIQRVKPIFFVGNAPLGHLPSSDATTFFMLAQAVGEPFDVKLKDGSSEVAWLTKREVLEQAGPSEGELLTKML